MIQSEDVPAHSRGVLHITNVQQFYERGGDDALGRYDDLMALNDEAHHAHLGRSGGGGGGTASVTAG